MTWAFFAPRTWLRFTKNRKISGYGETETIHLPKETSLIADTKITKLALGLKSTRRLTMIEKIIIIVTHKSLPSI